MSSDQVGLDLVWRTIERYVPLTDEDRSALRPLWRPHTFSKGEFISKAGAVERHFFVVLSGVQRLFFEHGGNGICLGFAYDHSWSGDYESFIQQRPGRLNVQAVTDSVLMGIDHADLQHAYEQVPMMDRFGRLILEELLVGRATREIEQISLSASERYQRLVDRSPHLLQLVSQKDIASYLRMTPETFSRMRAKVG